VPRLATARVDIQQSVVVKGDMNRIRAGMISCNVILAFVEDGTVERLLPRNPWVSMARLPVIRQVVKPFVPTYMPVVGMTQLAIDRTQNSPQEPKPCTSRRAGTTQHVVPGGPCYSQGLKNRKLEK
jgi:hypothetical protein